MLAFDIKSPFKSVDIEFEEEPENKIADNPSYCEADADCEWTGCNCHNIASDKTGRCLINMSVSDCMCLENKCIPDIGSMMDDYNGINLRKYQRLIFFRPECPKTNYLFMGDLRMSETGILVLAFKGTDRFNDFLDENCGSPLMRPAMDEALGGDFFAPCDGFDAIYDRCASFNATEDCATWLDDAGKEIGIKQQHCQENFDDCSFHEDMKKKMERYKGRCMTNTSEYAAHCTSRCADILSIKNKCESQDIDKDEFKKQAYEKLVKLCRSRPGSLGLARKDIIDEDLSIDIIELELQMDDTDHLYNRHQKLNIFDSIIFKIKNVFHIAKELDDPKALKTMIIKDIGAHIAELEKLKTETDNTALKEGIEDQINILNDKKELLD